MEPIFQKHSHHSVGKAIMHPLIIMCLEDLVGGCFRSTSAIAAHLITLITALPNATIALRDPPGVS